MSNLESEIAFRNKLIAKLNLSSALSHPVLSREKNCVDEFYEDIENNKDNTSDLKLKDTQTNDLNNKKYSEDKDGDSSDIEIIEHEKPFEPTIILDSSSSECDDIISNHHSSINSTNCSNSGLSNIGLLK